ncbi:YidH family protein [Paracoccus sp. (in: a-proteobacteria)]|uniref:YidH family protein n=1 Tax=Paracoccus sp. TaxID=267 RepID=UPI00396CFAC7
MASKDHSGDNRKNWAEDRTDWAEDRTILAVERTFSGWIRTGLATAAVALGLHAVFGPFQPTWVPKAVATIFLLAAQLIFLGAWLENRKSRSRLSSHQARHQPAGRITLLTVLLSLGIAGTGLVLWLL